MENIYVQFDGMVYQKNSWDSYGHYLCSTYSQLISICYERDFMSNLQKSKRFDLIDTFNDTSRYLDDIFTIDNPAFAEHIPDIYPENFSWVKQILPTQKQLSKFGAISFQEYVSKGITHLLIKRTHI